MTTPTNDSALEGIDRERSLTRYIELADELAPALRRSVSRLRLQLGGMTPGEGAAAVADRLARLQEELAAAEQEAAALAGSLHLQS